MLAKSRILSRPPTLTQTHPLQSSPKRTQRKKYISNLRLYSANSTNPNSAARTATAANQSSRTFVNNRGPTWTFAMISSHNSNSNSSSSASSSSRPSRRGSQPSGLPSRGGLPFNRSFGPKKELNRTAVNPTPGSSKNNTVVLSGLQASPVQPSKPPRSSGSYSKLLSSTRRPFLSRSINYRPPVVSPTIGTNQSTPARTLESDLSPNRPIETSRPKPSTNAKPSAIVKPSTKPSNVSNAPNAGSPTKPKTTTIVAISSGQHPFNFNPMQFMQTFFDQLFGPGKANGAGGTFFSFFN